MLSEQDRLKNVTLTEKTVMLMNHISTHFLHLEGIKTAYYSTEGEGTPIVLLHGGGADHAMLSWKTIMQTWSGSQPLIALDLPGYGNSDKPDLEYSLSFHTDFLKVFLDTLNAQNIILCGLSMGGAIALQYALRYPESIDKLVLVAPWGVSTSSPYSLMVRRLLVRLPLNQVAYKTLQNRWLAKSIIAGSLIGNREKITPEILNEVQAAARSKDAARVFQSFQISELWGEPPVGYLIPLLPQIKVPTLFIQGDKDPGIKVGDVKQAAASMPDARVEIFEHHKHWLQIESPERFVDIARSFIES